MEKITDIAKNMHEVMIAALRVFVATLRSGLEPYVGVNVLSEESVPVAPSARGSFFACLRAASDLNVGRAMAGSWQRCQ
jgi:hypothetical protein